MVFRKNLRSLELCWEKISKFLGDLPSEQIFYRNIPLGALGEHSSPTNGDVARVDSGLPPYVIRG